MLTNPLEAYITLAPLNMVMELRCRPVIYYYAQITATFAKKNPWACMTIALVTSLFTISNIALGESVAQGQAVLTFADRIPIESKKSQLLQKLRNKIQHSSNRVIATVDNC